MQRYNVVENHENCKACGGGVGGENALTIKITSISNFDAIRFICSDVVESFHVGKGKDGSQLNLKRRIMVNAVDYTRLVLIMFVNDRTVV
jgi:hypothetical protein